MVAQKLRGATDATAREARDACLAYWIGHGRQHFPLEEDCCSQRAQPTETGTIPLFCVRSANQ